MLPALERMVGGTHESQEGYSLAGQYSGVLPEVSGGPLGGRGNGTEWACASRHFRCYVEILIRGFTGVLCTAPGNGVRWREWKQWPWRSWGGRGVTLGEGLQETPLRSHSWLGEPDGGECLLQTLSSCATGHEASCPVGAPLSPRQQRANRAGRSEGGGAAGRQAGTQCQAWKRSSRSGGLARAGANRALPAGWPREAAGPGP